MTDHPFKPDHGCGSHHWAFVPADPDRRLPRWFWVMLIAMALTVVGISVARAAEVPGRWEITLFHAGKDYDVVARTHRVLAVYDSREECRNAIVRVRVQVSGARLVCNPVGQERVR